MERVVFFKEDMNCFLLKIFLNYLGHFVYIELQKSVLWAREPWSLMIQLQQVKKGSCWYVRTLKLGREWVAHSISGMEWICNFVSWDGYLVKKLLYFFEVWDMEGILCGHESVLKKLGEIGRWDSGGRCGIGGGWRWSRSNSSKGSVGVAMTLDGKSMIASLEVVAMLMAVRCMTINGQRELSIQTRMGGWD